MEIYLQQTNAEETMGKQNERTDQEKMLRSSAAEYLTYVASTGDQKDSVEMRYEDENI